MDKKYIGRQPSADNPPKIGSKPGLLHTVAEKIFTAFGLTMFLSIPLFTLISSHSENKLQLNIMHK